MLARSFIRKTKWSSNGHTAFARYIDPNFSVNISIRLKVKNPNWVALIEDVQTKIHHNVMEYYDAEQRTVH